MTESPIGPEELYSLGFGICTIICAMIHGDPDRSDDTGLDYVTCVANCTSPFDILPDRDTDKSDDETE